MSIQSTLKKEGINVIGKLNTLEINKIAANISEKITQAFPEHNINQHDLFIAISRFQYFFISNCIHNYICYSIFAIYPLNSVFLHL